MAKGLHIRELKEGNVYMDQLSGQRVLILKVTLRLEWCVAKGKRFNQATGADQVIDIEDGQLIPLT